MAKINNKVLLGYEDEVVTEKHNSQLNFTINKIGGEPVLPSKISKLDLHLNCSLCELPSHLVVQIYAPLDNSTYHRTLYLFACINPNCWNRSESWKCLRLQTEEKITTTEPEETNACAPKLATTDWCTDADDWGDDDNNANFVEENCNIIGNTGNEKVSDDEESSSFEDSIRSGFGNFSIDEKNANNGAHGGAVGRLHSPMATAEIEGDEGEVVTVESPTSARSNIIALMQETTPLSHPMSGVSENSPFVSHFMSVWEEEEDGVSNLGVDTHVKELLAEYQQKNAELLSPENRGRKNSKIGGDGDMAMAHEEYEKSRPAHGDKMFHHFVSKVQANPGQILRYNRDGSPLLLYPLQDPLKRCRYCQGEVIFELQLVPTIISKLRLQCDYTQCARLEFGTVLVYTCKKSCWSTNDYFKEEIVVLQSENY